MQTALDHRNHGRWHFPNEYAVNLHFRNNFDVWQQQDLSTGTGSVQANARLRLRSGDDPSESLA